MALGNIHKWRHANRWIGDCVTQVHGIVHRSVTEGEVGFKSSNLHDIIYEWYLNGLVYHLNSGNLNVRHSDAHYLNACWLFHRLDHSRARASTACSAFIVGVKPVLHVSRVTTMTTMQTNRRKPFNGQIAYWTDRSLLARATQQRWCRRCRQRCCLWVRYRALGRRLVSLCE